jgi:5-methyltetrahydrofolate--homocysteine methyltransferase
MIENKTIDARAILGFYPANSNGEDDIIVKDESMKELAKFCTLRQ